MNVWLGRLPLYLDRLLAITALKSADRSSDAMIGDVLRGRGLARRDVGAAQKLLLRFRLCFNRLFLIAVERVLETRGMWEGVVQLCVKIAQGLLGQRFNSSLHRGTRLFL